MPKDTKTLGNNKARACESLGFVHKKRLCQRFDTTSIQFHDSSYHIHYSDRYIQQSFFLCIQHPDSEFFFPLLKNHHGSTFHLISSTYNNRKIIP